MRRLILSILAASILSISLGAALCSAQSIPTPAGTDVLYLSGTGCDNTVKWDFFCTDGANSGKWTKIEVPSCWELQGFGAYNYGHDRDPHHEQGL